jgi:hypothetical protein
MLHRCQACKGQKQVFKLGLQHGNCDECKGIGYITHVKAIEDKNGNKKAIVTRKRKGNFVDGDTAQEA